MHERLNRRSFLQLGAAAGAAAMLPGWMNAQTPALPDRVLQGRAAALKTPITTTKLYDNVYLMQGAGGNMALQTGPEGNILIDSNFATAVPKIREAIAAVSHDAPDALINTHWHYDHTDGNEGMHAAGFTIFAHRNTRERRRDCSRGLDRPNDSIARDNQKAGRRAQPLQLLADDFLRRGIHRQGQHLLAHAGDFNAKACAIQHPLTGAEQLRGRGVSGIHQRGADGVAHGLHAGRTGRRRGRFRGLGQCAFCEASG